MLLIVSLWSPFDYNCSTTHLTNGCVQEVSFSGTCRVFQASFVYLAACFCAWPLRRATLVVSPRNRQPVCQSFRHGGRAERAGTDVVAPTRARTGLARAARTLS